MRKASVLVMKNFVGNKKVQVYADFVTKMLIDLKYLGYNVTIKMH